MSVTINFTASTDADVASVKVWEATTSAGEYSFVYSSGIDTTTTSVTYADGSVTNWYRLSFVDTSDNESALSAAIYGGGESWSDYMIGVFRTYSNDWGTPQRNSDTAIKRKLVVAGSQLYQMALPIAPFDCAYTFTVDAGSGDAWDITPDPIYGCKDDDYVNLWLLKSMCEESRQGMMSAASNGIKIKDGDSSIDTSASFGGYETLLDSKGGPCMAFKAAWQQYIHTANAANANSGMYNMYTNFGADMIPGSYIHIDRS